MPNPLDGLNNDLKSSALEGKALNLDDTKFILEKGLMSKRCLNSIEQLKVNSQATHISIMALGN